VRHAGRRCCAMPVFLVWRKLDDIAGPDFFDWTAFALHATRTSRDNQRLSERMRVPHRARTRFESDSRASGSRRSFTLK
jgi:hypothetical protein